MILSSLLIHGNCFPCHTGKLTVSASPGLNLPLHNGWIPSPRPVRPPRRYSRVARRGCYGVPSRELEQVELGKESLNLLQFTFYTNSLNGNCVSVSLTIIFPTVLVLSFCRTVQLYYPTFVHFPYLHLRT